MSKKKDGIGETIKTIIYALLIAGVFRTFLFQPFWIPSGSMKPTLLIGDFLFVSKFSYGYSKHSFPWSLGPFDGRILASEPQRGDVIVFKHPRSNEDYIKRLVGLPGDKLQMINGVLHINGEAVGMVREGDWLEPTQTSHNLNCTDYETIDDAVFCSKELYKETLPNGVSHDVLNANDNTGFGTDNTRVFTVPEGKYFFMGDNRDNSNDSRQGVGMVPFENLVGKAEMVVFSFEGPFWQVWNWRGDRFFEWID